MKCPNCGKGDGVIMYQDAIVCNKCGNELNIDYCLCPICQYSWRENDGVFMDGGLVNMDGLEEAFEQIDKMLMNDNGEIETPSMFDDFYNCLRCGEPAIRDGNIFECTVCGFKWEILPLFN